MSEQAVSDLGSSIGQLCAGSFWVLIIALAVVLIVREVWCWYWKINHMRKAQGEQTELLEMIVDNLEELRRLAGQKVPQQTEAQRSPPAVRSPEETSGSAKDRRAALSERTSRPQ